jgi:hypothetical protein
MLFQCQSTWSNWSIIIINGLQFLPIPILRPQSLGGGGGERGVAWSLELE